MIAYQLSIFAENKSGKLAKVTGVLAKEKINIDSITTSEIRISCLVDKAQGDKALICVCKTFELDKPVNKRSYVK